MANPEHIAILKQGVKVWDAWRKEHPDVRADLFEADLTETNLFGADLFETNLMQANLKGADLREAILFDANLKNANLFGADLRQAFFLKVHLQGADLTEAHLQGADLVGTALTWVNLNRAIVKESNLSECDLYMANLSEASLIDVDLSRTNLTGADLRRTNLSQTNLRGAILQGANLEGANLEGTNLTAAILLAANLSGAKLVGANLTAAQLIGTILTKADLTGAHVYGVSVWNVEKDGLIQRDLIITPPDEPVVTVDDVEVAQFLHLLLKNEKIRDVITTITSKAVLILGRFTEERKRILDAIRDALRQRGYVPIVFDFEPSKNRNLTETVQLLANMATFVIADVTDPKSIPQELSHIIPNLPSVPVQPIILASNREYAMFEHWKNFNSVLPLLPYEDEQHLLERIETGMLAAVKLWKEETDKAAVEKRLLQETMARKNAENAQLQIRNAELEAELQRLRALGAPEVLSKRGETLL